MKNILNWILGFDKEASGEVASNRMKLMVIHDRAQLPPEKMAKMKSELMGVIKKYFEVDDSEAEFLIETHEQVASIITNAPLRAKFVGDKDVHKKEKANIKN